MNDKTLTFWIGLETDSAPHGHGEDYREYLIIEKDDPDIHEKLHAAVLRRANAITRWSNGSRIAVRLCKTEIK